MLLRRTLGGLQSALETRSVGLRMRQSIADVIIIEEAGRPHGGEDSGGLLHLRPLVTEEALDRLVVLVLRAVKRHTFSGVTTSFCHDLVVKTSIPRPTPLRTASIGSR